MKVKRTSYKNPWWIAVDTTGTIVGGGVTPAKARRWGEGHVATVSAAAANRRLLEAGLYPTEWQIPF